MNPLSLKNDKLAENLIVPPLESRLKQEPPGGEVSTLADKVGDFFVHLNAHIEGAAKSATKKDPDHKE